MPRGNGVAMAKENVVAARKKATFSKGNAMIAIPGRH